MRYITLLEFQPGMSAKIIPPSSYLETTNGTLAAEHTRLLVDEQGFMVTEREAAPSDVRVLLLGGSSIENLYVQEDERVLAVLERGLGDAGIASKVYSAGISNAHLLHLLNLLLNKGIALRPQMVVWYPTSGSDVVANERANTFWNRSDAMATIRKTGREPRIDLSCAFNDRNGFSDERALLRSMFAICRNFGIHLAVGTWSVYGTWDDYIARFEVDRDAFEAGDAAMRRLNDVIREVCIEEEGVLIDLADAFAHVHRPAHFYDRNHPNGLGCRIIAEATQRAIGPVLSTLSPR